MDTAEFVNVDSNNKVFFFFFKGLVSAEGAPGWGWLSGEQLK